MAPTPEQIAACMEEAAHLRERVESLGPDNAEHVIATALAARDAEIATLRTFATRIAVLFASPGTEDLAEKWALSDLPDLADIARETIEHRDDRMAGLSAKLWELERLHRDAERERVKLDAEIATLRARLTAPPDDERERGIAAGLAAALAAPEQCVRVAADTDPAILSWLASLESDIPYLLTRLAALRARVVGVEGERQRWADIATERKIDLQNADALAHAVRCALGGGATGWVPGRGVDTLIDLALDIRAERDSLAAIRRYLEAAVQLGADTSGREDVAAEWEAIPPDDRSRLEAWGNRVCTAGIEAGEDEAEELREERDTLRREVEGLRAALEELRPEYESASRSETDAHAFDVLASALVARLLTATAALGGPDARK